MWMMGNLNSAIASYATIIAFVVVFVYDPREVVGLDNGLALTPPMGWLAWERYMCNIDCEIYPDECVSEKLFMNVADLLVNEGYSDLGYKYVVVDDCWLAKNRSADGKLVADPERFPNGIKALSDYIHSKGLKFGLYQDVGDQTCAGYPGVLGYEAEDARQFAEWEVDYVKLDGCYFDVRQMDKGYVDFGKYLNDTGRPMVYSCSWPAYQDGNGMLINYTELALHCNLWRNYWDIEDSWSSVMSIADYFALKQEIWAQHAGPGHWNDPDMLVIGNYGLSLDQSKSQMAIWAILAAPLLMSNKLSAIRTEFKEILQNKEIIEVNQDLLGIQGSRVFRDEDIDTWVRPVEPVYQGQYSYAMAFVSRRQYGASSLYETSLEDLGMKYDAGYTIKNLFDAPSEKQLKYHALPQSVIRVHVNPSGVVFLRLNVSVKKFENDLYYSSLNNTIIFS